MGFESGSRFEKSQAKQEDPTSKIIELKSTTEEVSKSLEWAIEDLKKQKEGTNVPQGHYFETSERIISLREQLNGLKGELRELENKPKQ